MLPFLLTTKGPRLVGLVDGALWGVDLIEGEAGPVEATGVVQADPAAVFFGADVAVESVAMPLAAEATKRIGSIKPRGQAFATPEGFVTGYSYARPVIESLRGQVPHLDAIRHSAIFSGLTIRVGIEATEKAYACLVGLYEKTGGFPPLEDVRGCIRALGFPRTREPMYREIMGWAHEVQNAIASGLRDRELRRHLLTQTKVPTLLGIAKVSFTLALLGQDVVCIDARLANRMKIDVNQWGDKSDLSIRRYERAEDAFLSGNPNYDPSDPIGKARCQWLSWEASPVKGGVRPASHSAWVNVVRPLAEGRRLHAVNEVIRASEKLAREGYVASAYNFRWAPGSLLEEEESGSAKFERCVRDVKKKGGDVNPWAVCHASVGREASRGATTRPSVFRPLIEDPEDAARVVSAVESIHVVLTDTLGQGDRGIAYSTADGRVLKVTTDESEVKASFVLVGKRLPHVVRIDGAWFIRGLVVGRRASRVGLVLQERVRPLRLEGALDNALTNLVFKFKESEKSWPRNFVKMTQDEKRKSLYAASVGLEEALRTGARRASTRALFNDVADALKELREAGVYAIDVHGGNVGFSRTSGRYKIFDIGVASTPRGAPAPLEVAESSGEVPEIGEEESRSTAAYKGWETRSERDEAVAVNLPPSLLPLWSKIGGQFRGTPEERLEAFLQYVHEHEDETVESMQSEADRKLEALIATRPGPRRMAGEPTDREYEED